MHGWAGVWGDGRKVRSWYSTMHVQNVYGRMVNVKKPSHASTVLLSFAAFHGTVLD
jgi:hypothetical protein